MGSRREFHLLVARREAASEQVAADLEADQADLEAGQAAFRRIVAAAEVPRQTPWVEAEAASQPTWAARRGLEVAAVEPFRAAFQAEPCQAVQAVAVA